MPSMNITKPVAVPAGAGPLHADPSLSTVRDLLSINDLSPRQITALLEVAADVKSCPRAYRGALDGLSTVLLFEKPSLRTRMSFEIGLTKLGGHVVYFDHAAQRIGQRESIKDYAKNLERWCDAVVARVFDHAVLAQLAEHAAIPVINALSDLEHPCQALADMLTIRERLGAVAGVRLAWIGDGNNVCHSLTLAAAKLGAHVTVITPPSRRPSEAVIASATRAAQAAGGSVTQATDPRTVAGHDAVYTDAWVSMGQAGLDGAANPFHGYGVDERLMALAGPGAIFMHCLPAHRGEEVSDAVIDSPASVVYDQAENRMHAQNALMLAALGRLPGVVPAAGA